MSLTPTPRDARRNNSSAHPRCEQLERRSLFTGIPLYLAETVTAAGIELSIDGTPGDDRISVVATEAGLVIANKGGWSVIVPNHYALLCVNAARGNDMLIVDGSVTADTVLYGSNGDDTILGGAGGDRIYGGFGRDRILAGAGDDTIVTIGDSVWDRTTGGDGHDSFWTDSARTEIVTDATPQEIAAGAVHRVGAFYTAQAVATSLDAAASRELGGQDLPDPTPGVRSMQYADFSGLPLFSQAGPTPTDINQGAVGDCYFLAPLASVAQQNPGRIRQSVAELGDGTFAVRFHRNGVEAYVRVDSDLPTWSGASPAYAALGAERSLWVAIMEKAYAFFRQGSGTYASLNRGWMTEGYEALGAEPLQITPATTKAADLLARLEAELDAGAAMTWATDDIPAGIPLVPNHAYSIEAVNLDAQGRAVSLLLRNPWAVDGAGDDGANDGYVTLTSQQLAASFWAIVYARV